MRETKVKVAELLDKIKANREKHIVEYEEAAGGYRESAKIELQKGIERLKKRIAKLGGKDLLRLGCVSFSLAVPENHEKDYDQVITMLEMCVDTEVVIKSDEFACYVMDDWDWKDDFVNTSNIYKSMK